MNILTLLTAPLSCLFGAAVYLRNKCFDLGLRSERSFSLPVICVGNLAVGGTGKSPHVELILRLLRDAGFKVAMLSRGYGRRTKGFVLATPQHTAEEIGDEPLQILRNCPFATVAVCEKRVNGIEQLLRLKPDLEAIVLDDAFQHRYVRAGLNLLLTSAASLYTRDKLLPWGRLREPASAAARADAVIVTKCSAQFDEKVKIRRGVGSASSLPLTERQKLFFSRIVYRSPYKFQQVGVLEPDIYEEKDVVLLAGIANPAPLIRHLESFHPDSLQTLLFPDHHAFTARDVRKLNLSIRGLANPLLVTTEKDAARLAAVAEHLPDNLRQSLIVQPIAVEVEPETTQLESFNQYILKYVATNSRNRSVD